MKSVRAERKDLTNRTTLSSARFSCLGRNNVVGDPWNGIRSFCGNFYAVTAPPKRLRELHAGKKRCTTYDTKPNDFESYPSLLRILPILVTGGGSTGTTVGDISKDTTGPPGLVFERA